MIRTLSLRLAACALVACVTAAHAQRFDYEQEERAPRYIPSASADSKPTPVPILKQVNRHNEDGSYTYGYEAADGSFKIETKLANGEVKGKYGYRDDTGKVRTIEYGANKYGFQPSGEGITVAPPTLVDESAQEERRATKQFGGGGGSGVQYRADTPDYDYEEAAPAPASRPQPAYRAPQPAPYRAPAARAPQHHTAAHAAARPPKPAFFAGAAPAPVSDTSAYFRPEPQPQQAYRAAPQPQFQFEQSFQPQDQFSAPAPRKQYSAQQFPAPQQQFPAPQQQFPAPQQQFPAPQQQPAYRPAAPAQQPGRQPFSMLDQLIKEYGLPQGGSPPLHDITFGSY